MSEAVKSRLFRLFFTTQPTGKGTEPGMAISHQIVQEKHKGLLDCQYQLGVGTKFTIQIPI